MSSIDKHSTIGPACSDRRNARQCAAGELPQGSAHCAGSKAGSEAGSKSAAKPVARAVAAGVVPVL